LGRVVVEEELRRLLFGHRGWVSSTLNCGCRSLGRVVVEEELRRMLFSYRGWELILLGGGIDVDVLLFGDQHEYNGSTVCPHPPCRFNF
jgi:hypothetical protein